MHKIKENTLFSKKLINRRSLLAAGLLMPPAMMALPAYAAENQIFPFDTGAVFVRNPSKVYLIAITRASTRLFAVGEHGVIITSNDDGLSWSQAKAPVDVSLTSVAFATPDIGWAAGAYGVILKTEDGGKSWVRQLDGVEANQLTLSAAKAFAATHNGSNGATVALRRANIFVNAGPSNPFLCILAIDSQNAIVFGAYRLTMRTSDAGKTWTDWSLNVEDPYSHNLYGVAAIGSDIFLVGEMGLIFCSRDGGNSFPQLNSPATATLFGVCGVHRGRVMVYGVAGQIYYSDDQGSTWTASKLALGSNIIAVRMLSSGIVLLIGELGAVFRSADNGATFTPMALQGMMLLTDVAEAPNGNLVLTGNFGIQIGQMSSS